MNELELTFEQSPWEAYLMTKQMGDTVSAVRLLTLVEEDNQALEDALEDLETACMNLDISELPAPGASGEGALRLRQELQFVKQGMRPETLGESDPLRMYLEEVAALPVCGDENLLAQRCSKGDEDAMVQLTNLGLSRVVELAAEHAGFGVMLMDLIQEGSLGLWQAVRGYRRGDYEAHRDRWIRFYMARTVVLQAHASGVGQKLRTAVEDYREVDERLLSELGRNPTLEEIAEQLHMTPEEAAMVRNNLEATRNMAQVKQEPDPEEEQEAQEQAVEDTALFQMRQRINELLSALSPEDAKLLTLRFGLEGAAPLTPEQTGDRLGLTPGEVVAREAAALAKLRG